MSYHVEGDYFESCNCLITCRCTFGTTFDGDACDVFIGWHISRGQKDGVDLGDLNVTLARHRPRDLEKDQWLVELYLDEQASPDQSAALESIFSGQAGGHLQVVAPRIGKVTAVRSSAIAFEKTGKARRLRVAGVLDVEGQELVGMDGVNPAVISNPTVWAGATQPLRQGKADRIHYAGGWTFDTSDTNSFITEFKYESQ
ncbi:MAG TPA: DUF1326 domain-containing protein [Candidatus Dormibacteraeota bacterium]|jgi:hypothetical protein